MKEEFDEFAAPAQTETDSATTLSADSASSADPAPASSTPAEPEPATAGEATPPATVDLAAVIAEAEKRGYNRAVEELSRTAPGHCDLWQQAPVPPVGVDDDDTRQLSFLSYIRPSVWD